MIVVCMMWGCSTPDPGVAARRSRDICRGSGRPEACYRMGKAALTGVGGLEPSDAFYGLDIACSKDVRDACTLAVELPKIGIDLVVSGAVLSTPCLDGGVVNACRALLVFLEQNPEGWVSKEGLAKARALAAGP